MEEITGESMSPDCKQWTRERFVAAKMANLCWVIAHSETMPSDLVEAAKECYRQWDDMGYPQLNNPVVMAELESMFFGV